MLGVGNGHSMFSEGTSAVQKTSIVAERICIARLEAWYRAKRAYCFYLLQDSSRGRRLCRNLCRAAPVSLQHLAPC